MSSSPSCEYCGRCLSVCPSYKHHLVETMGPRARIDLANAVAAGQLEPGRRYEQSIKSCLQCLACTEICGKGVDGAQIILNARLAQKEYKKSAARRLEEFFVSTVLTRRSLLKKSLAVLRLAQKILPMDKGGNIRHLPDALSGFMGKRSLPELSAKSIDAMLPEHNMPEQAAIKGEVALFTGCFGGLADLSAALRLTGALNRLGYIVHIPRGQSCCGAPAQLSGFAKAFEKAQSRNAQVFSQYKDMPVLTQCATCHRTLAREYAGDGKELAGRIVDSALFLSRNSAFSGIGLPDSALLDALGLPSRKGRPVTESDPLIVTVHDPCHLRLDPDAGRAVRSMLASNPLIKLIELSEPGICCGGGGVSSLKNPALADELGEARAQAVMKTGADVVVSQCPGCVLQLNNHLKRLNAVQRARHALEIITLHI